MSFTPLFGQKIMYGADYNPEQWLEHDEGFETILNKDLEMMQQAHCNIMSVGIFSWAKLEVNEDEFDFSWLDEVLDRLNEKGIKVFLATPSGARPHWLANKYPEVLRVNERRERALFGARHNHCMTSPKYRERVRIINTKLAERYGHHPAVIGWHLSNEYGGQCHCPLCQAKFREWLKQKYGTIENLNKQWWNTFWSHTYTDWSDIESPSSIGENGVHALYLDWMRFSSENALDFCKAERDTVKAITPDLPVTANFMEFFYDYDYFNWAPELDFISWDAYPQWHNFADPDYIASYTAMNHDLMRSLKGGQPFVLMESTPTNTNWRPLSTLKRPGMNILSSLQAVAHGADSVQYFQWRKSRGSSEKFHGAIVDHVGHLDTRAGREVIELGKILEKLSEVAGSAVDAKVADSFSNDANTQFCAVNEIPDGWEGLDIGPKTEEIFANVIKGSKTILWNGPTGVFEFDNFTHGSRAVADAIVEATKNGAFSLVGGGDSVACVNKFGLAKEVSYVSTGGGALLEAIEGKILPGIAAINE